MFKSNYNNEPTPTIGEEVKNELKKKWLKLQQEEPAPSVQELDAELQGNKPAVTKELADKSLEFQDQGYKFSGGLEGNYISKDKPSTNNTNNTDNANDTNNGTGAKAASAAIGAMGMASTIMSQKKVMTKKENEANIMNLTAQGAQVGSAFGPWGTLIGAGVGAGTGAIIDEKKK